MIYLFEGTDTARVRTKAFEWIAKARLKEPNLMYVRLSREELTDESLEEAAFSGGLFVKRLLVLIDEPFEKSDTELSSEKNVFKNQIKKLASSDNAIVVLASNLNATTKKELAAQAKHTYTFDRAQTKETSRGFNANLVNALANRSREKLWLELERAIIAGDAPEMLHGLLHWKTRDLMEKGSRLWTRSELRTFSLKLLLVLQESRRGGSDLALALERFVLSI